MNPKPEVDPQASAGDDPLGLSSDPMSLLRQTTEQAKAVTQGTVSNPEIAASRAGLAANQAALSAIPQIKYSRDGIPSGLDHVAEMERIHNMMQGGTATANDIDNYITLEIARRNAAGGAQNAGGPSEGAGVSPVPDTPSPAVPEPRHDAPARTGSRPAQHSNGAGARQKAQVSAPTGGGRAMGEGGVPPAPRTEGRSTVPQAQPPSAPPRAGRADGANSHSSKVMDSKSAAQPPKGVVDHGRNYTNMENNGAAYKMASTGMSFTDGSKPTPPQRGMASYEDPRMTAWVRQQNPPEDKPSKVAMKNGPQADEPATNVATRNMLAELIPSSILPVAAAGAGLKAAKPIASKIEQEVIPGAQMLARRMMGSEARGANKVAQEVNNNISRVAKPPGLVKAALPPRPNAQAQAAAADAETLARAAQRASSKASVPPTKNSTEVAHKASEYLDKSAASAAAKSKVKADMKRQRNQGKGQNL